LIGLGILGFIKGDFDATWPPAPKGVPEVVGYLCAFIYAASGIGLLWHRIAALASRVLLAYHLRGRGLRAEADAARPLPRRTRKDANRDLRRS
jgi:hypothetical protein